MKPSESLKLHREAVLRLAGSIGATNVRIFGSVLSGEDAEESDVDILVDVPRGTTLLDMVRLQDALEAKLGTSVDVVTAGDLPASFRDHILRTAKPL